jgi:hypothetical protein
MPRLLRENLTGRDFGRWHVLGPAGINKHRNRLWHVRCSCGTEAERTLGDLRRKSQSCGCLRAEQLAERNRNVRYNPVTNRAKKAKPPRPCDHCHQQYVPYRSRSKYCSTACKSRAAWEQIAADPERKAAHNRRVCDERKRDTHVDHPACEQCGEPFRGPPERLHCSRECLDAKIASGVYRNAFHKKRAAGELAALRTELERRLNGTQPTDE